MPADEAALRPLSARRSETLHGRIGGPGDKSIRHHALMLGAVSVDDRRSIAAGFADFIAGLQSPSAKLAPLQTMTGAAS